MKVKVEYSPRFIKSFNRLSHILREQTVDKEKIFKNNCFNPSLRTHKLKGQLSGYWSFSVNYYCRVLFQFISEDEVVFVNIGGHGIYK